MRGFVRMLVFIGFAIACSDIVFAQQTMDAQIASLIDQIKKKANLKLDSTTTQVAIDTETYELRHLSDPALIAAVDEDGANALAAKQLSNAKSPFSNPQFTFSKQVIEATLEYKSNVSVPVAGPVDVDAELRAQLSPTVAFASDSPNAEFMVRSRGREARCLLSETVAQRQALERDRERDGGGPGVGFADSGPGFAQPRRVSHSHDCAGKN